MKNCERKYSWYRDHEDIRRRARKEEKACQIRSLRQMGLTYKDIAKMRGTTPERIKSYVA